jgi:hypothetical protein
MAPSLLKIGALALAAVGEVSANQWYLDETYDHTNFFEKFNFFQSRYNTGVPEDIDPTHGYVQYMNQSKAWELGLINYVDGEVVIGVDHKSTLDPDGTGRPSVRVESKKLYTQGLFVARFSHLPTAMCGVWPAL